MMKAAALHAALHALPVVPLADIVPGTAMILAPHPDDESLGCGGLIAACCAAGRPPLVVVMTDGVASHPHSSDWPATRLRMQRQGETLRAVACLGLAAQRVVFLNLPDTAVPHEGRLFTRVVTTLAGLARRHGCATVLAPWWADPHCDHEATWKTGVALCQQGGFALWAYPVWGWLLAPDREMDEGAPHGVRLDITACRAAKAQAVRMHESQYGGLITDDPTGFTLPETLLDALITDFEVFVRP
ncbi:LmbE family protein [Gluconacetobacter sp. SXCC-1]|nr:LmbE family protein [Gluconacetobacter sp. SXCC-1]